MWNNFLQTMRSTVKLSPAFAILSVGGALLARFLFGIADAQIGVVVSIWMACAFVLWHIALAVIPSPTEKPERPPTALLLFSFPLFLGLAFGPVFLLASGAYSMVGLPDIAVASMHVAVGCFAVILCQMGIIVAMAVAVATSLHHVCRIVIYKTALALSEFLRTPAQLVDHLSHPVPSIR